MKVMTFKVSPKMIFGLILVVVGIIVVTVSFFSNHISRDSKEVSTPISCSTSQERQKYLTSLGWELGEETTKELTIPSRWTEVYNNYNEIQLSQGYDLTAYKGKTVTLYTYEITNYEGCEEGVVANMLVSDNKLIGGDICNTSAKDGFIHEIEKRK